MPVTCGYAGSVARSDSGSSARAVLASEMSSSLRSVEGQGAAHHRKHESQEGRGVELRTREDSQLAENPRRHRLCFVDWESTER